jgi:hypothetical protein
MRTFPATAARNGKASRGATDVVHTPLTIRAKPRKLGARAEADVRARVTRAFGRWAPMIASIAVRIEDENGPKGGVDLRFALQLELTGHAPLHVESTAATLPEAAAATHAAGERAMKKLLGRLGRSAGRTPEPGPSLPPELASPRRRRGHEHRNDSRAAFALEDSATRPSRKSTRTSSNRQKAATPKERTTQLQANAPSAVAARARARRSGTRATSMP